MNAPLSKEQWQQLRQESAAIVPELADQLGLPNVLLGYQGKTVKLLESSAVRVLFIEKSRRVGETWALASYAVLRASRAKSAGGMDAMYISYSQEMTREFIDAAAMWARAFSMVALDTQEFLFEDANPADPSDTRSIQAFRIRFASGFEIVALSSAPRTLRGKQGVVIIDEAAFVDNLKELLKAALAFLMWGGQVVVCSTHNGVDNEFNVQVQNILAGRSSYAHLKIDFDQALQDGLYQRICLVRGVEWSAEGEAQWRQDIIDDYGDAADEELFCIPTMGSGAWLTAPLIEARMTLRPDEAPIIRLELPGDFLQKTELERRVLLAPFWEELDDKLQGLDPELRHAFGYDVARKGDPAVAHLLAVEKQLRRRSTLTVELRNVPFKEQEKCVFTILEAAPKLGDIAIDATGLGMNLAENVGRKYGIKQSAEDAGRVWMVTFSQSWYNEHMPPLKAAFEDDMIALAPDDDHVGDLRLVKIVRGIPTIPPEREGAAAAKRHGDFAVALALAHFASRQRTVEYGYTAVPDPLRGTGRTSDDDFMRPQHDYGETNPNPFAGPLGARIRGGL